MINMINKFVFLIFYILFFIKDVKYKYITHRFLIIYFLIGFILSIFKISNNIEYIFEIFKSLVFGIILLIFSNITDESIGKGDTIYFIINSFYLNFLDNIILFILGIFSVGIYGFILYFIKFGKIKNKNVPFIPFLITGVCWRVLCM